MDRIEIACAGGKVAVSLRREVGQLARVRYITPEEAFSLALLLTTKPAEEALNFDVSAGVSLQILNAPYDVMFLSVDGRDGGLKLVACLEGAVIRKVGRCLGRIARSLLNSRPSRAKTHSFLISHSYLDEE